MGNYVTVFAESDMRRSSSNLYKVCTLTVVCVLLLSHSGASPEDDRPPLPASFNFMVPKKEISMVPDMGKWKRSQVYQ